MRQLFVCIHCGLRLSGRKYGGRIVAYDRAPDGDGEPEPCVCYGCLGELRAATTVPLAMPEQEPERVARVRAELREQIDGALRRSLKRGKP
jgi:hypothetical protein